MIARVMECYDSRVTFARGYSRVGSSCIASSGFVACHFRLLGLASHPLGTAEALDGPDGDAHFPEWNENMGGFIRQIGGWSL